MSTHLDPLSISQHALKRHAKRLQKELQKTQPDYKLTEAQNFLAKILGLNNWYEATTTIEKNINNNFKNKTFLNNCENCYNISEFLSDSHNVTHLDFEAALLIASKNGQIYVIEELNEYIKKHHIKIAKYIWQDCYRYASKKGYVNIIAYLEKTLLEKYTYDNLEFLFDTKYFFGNACRDGHLNAVKYFLHESIFKNYLSTQPCVDYGFLSAIVGLDLVGVSGSEQLDIIKYLLTSLDLNKNANINVNNDDALLTANFTFNTDLISYFLTSKDLKQHSNIYNLETFQKICERSIKYGDFSTLDYLFNEYKMKKEPDIIKVIEQFPSLKKYI